ncbi:MAG: hypothetical protein ACNA8H_08770, partial [Anaerolineales bacterium]
ITPRTSLIVVIFRPPSMLIAVDYSLERVRFRKGFSESGKYRRCKKDLALPRDRAGACYNPL